MRTYGAVKLRNSATRLSAQQRLYTNARVGIPNITFLTRESGPASESLSLSSFGSGGYSLRLLDRHPFHKSPPRLAFQKSIL